jgi:hypothetical protein
VLAVARPLSGRPAAAMAYKILMTDLHGWHPVSLIDDGDDGGDEEEGEDDDE